VAHRTSLAEHFDIVPYLSASFCLLETQGKIDALIFRPDNQRFYRVISQIAIELIKQSPENGVGIILMD